MAADETSGNAAMKTARPLEIWRAAIAWRFWRVNSRAQTVNARNSLAVTRSLATPLTNWSTMPEILPCTAVSSRRRRTWSTPSTVGARKATTVSAEPSSARRQL